LSRSNNPSARFVPDQLKLLRGLGISDRAIDRLVSMNDKESKTFDEIADWIEEVL
jgi:hypothetical protein